MKTLACLQVLVKKIESSFGLHVLLWPLTLTSKWGSDEQSTPAYRETEKVKFSAEMTAVSRQKY